MTDDSLQTLLQTKFSIPAVQAALVARPRLLARLDGAVQDEVRRLTLVSAPAGFGKTTLLSSWARECEASVAWLTLDEGDNDPVRFLLYLVAALRQVSADIGPEAAAQLQTPRPLPPAQVLTSLINDVLEVFPEGEARRLVLILDDYHLITLQRIHDALAFLIDHLPQQMHMILATRADPPLPLARLRGRGQLMEIRQADLAFGPDEARDFLNKVMALDLGGNAVDALNRRTEGWAAGLQMAALALRGSRLQEGGDRELIASFGGSHRYILDYLTEEVLQQQSQEVRTFLLQTSVLDRLSASLCDAVTAGHNGRAILERLDDDNLFVVALDEERQWYRYHRLFADLLRARLQQEMPEEISNLHLRAAEWYEERHELAPAIHHALAAQALSRAAGLVEQAAPATLQRSEVHTFLRWVDRLPAELVRRRPALTLYAAWASLFSGVSREQVVQELEAVPTDEEPWAARAGLLTAFDLLFQGQLARAQALSRRALERLPAADTFWRDIASWILSMALSSSGDAVVDEERLLRLSRQAQESGDLMIAASTLCALAGYRRRQAQLYRARETYRQALALAHDKEGKPLPVAGRALIGLGGLALEWNDLEAAARQLSQGIRLVSRWREIATLQGYVRLARVRSLQGDVAAAYKLLDEVESLAAAYDAVEWDDYYVAMQRAHLEISRGNLPAARQWVEARQVDVPFYPESEEMENRLRKYEHLVLARLLLAEGQPDRALLRLDPLGPFARESERLHLLIEVQLLRALALQAAGQEEEALVALEEALRCARPGGYVRLFLDEGPDMARLLHRAAQKEIMSDYVHSLLAAFGEAPVLPADRQPAAEQQDLVEPLSERELEVLELVARGLTNREIAQELVISVTTVKWHTGNIYGKLGVSNRTQAVASGRKLGLLARAP